MLTKVLTELLSSDKRKDHHLRGGLILSFLPPAELRISRLDTPPSTTELEVVQRHLMNMGYTSATSPLTSQTSPATGRTWHWYAITLYKQPTLI